MLQKHATLLACGLCLAAGFAVASASAPQGSGPTGGPTTPPPQQRQIPTAPAIATSDSNAQMIAVTGIDLTGSSILYLVDTQNRQLAVYQANGGSDSMQGVKLIGARRIDLDLKLYGFNDKSEYSFEELEKRFHEPKPDASASK
jgi:hypothetical protein